MKFVFMNTNITPDFHILHRSQDFSSITKIKKLPFLTFGGKYSLLLHNDTENTEHNFTNYPPFFNLFRG